MSTGNGLLSLIASLPTAKVLKWASNSDAVEMDERVDATILEGANVVSSKRSGHFRNYHAILLDLDVPAWLVPSSSPGHSHLYIDVRAKEEHYFALLEALEKCGVVESGYVTVSKKRGATFLRLPWIKKHKVAL